MKRTIKLARFLAKKEKANMEICIAASMLHQLHDARKVKKFLRKIKLDKISATNIADCIYWNEMHKIAKKPKISIGARIVFDADKLQMIGPLGFSRELAFRIKKDCRGFSATVKKSKRLQEKAFSPLQTKTARQIAKKYQAPMKDFYNYYEKFDKVKI